MGTIYRRPGRPVYMMQYYRRGVLLRETTGETDERRARKVLAAKETDRDRGLPVGPAVGKLSWDAAVTLFEADYTNNDYASLDDQQRRLRLHLTPIFGGYRMAEITAELIAAYTQHRRDANASAGTVNRELDILRRMFVIGVQQGRLLYRPHVPRLRERNARAGFFEPAMFASVRRHLPEALQPVVTFAYVTGWRIDSEVLTREWRHVDLDANEVRLDPGETKNGEPRVFPLTADLRALLLARRDARDAAAAAGHVCPWVFFRQVAKGRGGAKFPKPILRFNKAWAAACRAAGCPGRIPHDFRRTAVRNMVRRGVPERVAMQLTGHLTRSVFERYNIVSPGDLRDAAGHLEGLAPAPSAEASGKMITPAITPAGQSLTVSNKPIEKARKFGGAARI